MRLGIARKDLVILWGRAAAMCSHPDCKARLTFDATRKDDSATVGEAAHIVSSAPDGPRGMEPIRVGRRDRYENLILLCPTHHPSCRY